MRVRTVFAFPLSLLSALAVCGLPHARAAEPAKTHTVTAGDIKLTVPESWTQKEVASRFRLAQFDVPKVKGDTEDAEFVVFYFGAGGGGSVDANLHRWINQFLPHGRKVKLTAGKCSQGDYVLADLSGTWKKPVGPPIAQQTVEMPNARFLGVILATKDQGSYFLRFAGPEKTVSANAEALRATIGADPKSEKVYKLSEEN
jgi:gluconolactonase